MMIMDLHVCARAHILRPLKISVLMPKPLTGMMMDLHDMREYMFDGEEFAGYSCLGDLGEPLEGLEGIDESPEADGDVPKP